MLGSAECVAVVPSLLNGGFVFGGRYGKGVASCRTEKGWSAPAFFTIGGGSFGLQIGGQATDLVMLIMNKDGMDNLLSSQFKLGADASAAAGPVGRHAAADTDWKMRAEVLTYSRSRGLFAGLELSRRRHQAGQGQHPRILRPHGALQNISQGRNRSSQSRLPLLEHAGQVGAASVKVAVLSCSVLSSQFSVLRFQLHENWELRPLRTPTVRERLEYALVWPWVKLLGVLPRPLARAIGITFGLTVYAVHGRLRRVGLRNLALAFPEMSAARAPPPASRRIHLPRTPTRRSLPLPSLHPRKCLPRSRL